MFENAESFSSPSSAIKRHCLWYSESNDHHSHSRFHPAATTNKRKHNLFVNSFDRMRILTQTTCLPFVNNSPSEIAWYKCSTCSIVWWMLTIVYFITGHRCIRIWNEIFNFTPPPLGNAQVCVTWNLFCLLNQLSAADGWMVGWTHCLEFTVWFEWLFEQLIFSVSFSFWELAENCGLKFHLIRLADIPTSSPQFK